MTEVLIRAITEEDCSAISEAFKRQGWNKSKEKFRVYLGLQQAGARDFLLAEVNGQFAGYLTIAWQSDYRPFREQGIPEIVDFNVLKVFQRQGIGTTLMDEAERRIAEVASYAGIGFGVTKDYGAGQILYIKRGYIPDGNGLVKDSLSLSHGSSVVVDDNLVFYLTKRL